MVMCSAVNISLQMVGKFYIFYLDSKVIVAGKVSSVQTSRDGKDALLPFIESPSIAYDEKGWWDMRIYNKDLKEIVLTSRADQIESCEEVTSHVFDNLVKIVKGTRKCKYG